jgi:hypothetical protein
MNIFLIKKCLCKRVKLLKIVTLTMERKYLIENIAPLLNADVENSVGLLERMGLLKRILLCILYAMVHIQQNKG